MVVETYQGAMYAPSILADARLTIAALVPFSDARADGTPKVPEAWSTASQGSTIDKSLRSGCDER